MRGKRRLLYLMGALCLALAACRPASAPAPTPAPPTRPPLEPVLSTPAAVGLPAQPGQTAISAPLVGPVWILAGYGDVDNPSVPEEGTTITATFGSDGSLNGSAGCNNYSAAYRTDGERLTITSPIASTRMACEKGMPQESAYLTALAAAESYQVRDPILEIRYPGGMLRYNRNPPAESAMQAPGENRE